MKQHSRLAFIIIGSAFLLTQFSCALYLPAQGLIENYFKISTATMLQTLSLLFLGYAVGQLVWGGLSDCIGRRRTYLISFLGYAAVAFLVSSSQTFWLFRAALMSMGFFAATYTSVGNALLKDIYGSNVIKMIAYIGMIMGVGPALTPLLGAYLAHHFSWQFIFLFLMACALLLWCLFFVFVKDQVKPRPVSFFDLLSAYKEVITHRKFMRYVVVLALMFGVMFSYLGVAPWVFTEKLHLSMLQYGELGSLVALSYFVGSLVNRWLIHYYLPNRSMQIGCWIAWLASVFLSVCFWYGWSSVVLIALGFAVLLLGTGITVPAGKAVCMGVFDSNVGVAASLMKAIQSLGSVCMTFIVALVASHGLFAVGVLYGCVALACGALLYGRIE